jgi:regulator of protease activity HflC (stomatin/prohibitin superfamily)
MQGSRLFRLPFWLGLAALAAVLYGGWVWLFERIEVPPGKVLVRIHKWGKNLPEGELVAPDESYKGVMKDVWMPGRYFLNPLFWDCELHDLVQVKNDECLVLTRKYGRDIPKERLEAGDFLARDDEKGIVGEVKLPGSHPLNRYAYKWDAVPAVNVRADQVGVKTLRVGKDPRELKEKIELGKGLYVVDAGYRGVQKDTVPSGTYYLNPSVEAITPVEIRSHKVEFADIVFPSRDGFLLHPHVVVEYAVIPAKAPEVLVRISNEHGELHQQDSSEKEIEKNEILQRVVLPHIRGYARLAGSDFDARDFILTDHGVGDKKQLNSRERMQKTIEDKVKPLCAELGINVRAITMASLEPPRELTGLISERQQARVEQEKLKTELGTYKSQQTLEAKRAETPRSQQETAAKTRLGQEKTLAKQRMEVEEQKLKQELENANLRLEAARREADALLARGKAEAAVINAQNAAEVAGLKKAVQGFNGVQNFAQYHVLSKLGPAVSEIFASDDSELARLLTTYLNPPATISKPPASASANGTAPPER